MSIPETLLFKQLYVLGDVDGNNVGAVGAYNRVEVALQSPIPLEANCFFLFKFPKNLMIDQELSLVKGKDIFQPNSLDNNLDTNLYSVDIPNNTITV